MAIDGVQLAQPDWVRVDRPRVQKDSQSRASPNPSGGRRFAATAVRDNLFRIRLF